MRFQCTDWLEGFTVGSVYHAVYILGKSEFRINNDEGVIETLTTADVELLFEEC